jgi:hypothetical protein
MSGMFRILYFLLFFEYSLQIDVKPIYYFVEILERSLGIRNLHFSYF